MAWASVGYLALTTAELRCLTHKHLDSLFQDSPVKTLTFPNFWVESAEKAMAWARRDQVLEVGGAPSESESDKAVKLLLRAAAGQFKHAIECTNYVILQLKTKENVADAISRGDLILQELDGGDTCYVVSSWFSLFEEMPFQNKSKWTLTIELLACSVVYRDDGRRFSWLLQWCAHVQEMHAPSPHRCFILDFAAPQIHGRIQPEAFYGYVLPGSPTARKRRWRRH